MSIESIGFCQTEIQKFRAPGSQHNIAWLQIAVDYAAPMCPIQSARDLGADFENLIDWNRTSFQTTRQGFALDIFHHKKIKAVLAPDVVNYADMWVIQA